MHPMTSAGLTLAFLATLAPLHARAATPAEEIAALRAEIDALRQSYEARLQALDARLRAAEAAAATPAASAPAPARVTAQPAAPGVAPETPQPALPAAASSTAQPAAPAAAGAGSGNAFNPALSLILSGLATHTSQDPARYQITGFALPPDAEIGPGTRGFSLLRLASLQALHEAIDLAGSVHNSLLAGVEWMAVRADIDTQVLLGRMRRPVGTACRADDCGLKIFWVNSCLHGTFSKDIKRQTRDKQRSITPLLACLRLWCFQLSQRPSRRKR